MFRHRCRHAVILEAESDGSALVVPADAVLRFSSKSAARTYAAGADLHLLPLSALDIEQKAIAKICSPMRSWDMAVARVLIVLADFAITIIPPAAAQIDQPSIYREARSEYQLENSRRTVLPITASFQPRHLAVSASAKLPTARRARGLERIS